MIVRFQEMRQRLTEPEHLSIADEHEDYWRVQFYDRLRELILRLDLPFSWRKISRKAIAVIFDFAKWREGMSDPLESVDDKELFARGAIPPDFTDLRKYLEGCKEYWADVIRLREVKDECTSTL